MRNFTLVEETLGYVTAELKDNTDPRYLVAGSQNVLIDRNRKVASRRGYSRLGAANAALTPVRKGFTWNTSTGTELPTRMYDDELEVYLGTIDGTVIDAWTRVANSLNTSNTPRFDTWFDATENIDLLLFVQGDDNIYEWGGGVAVVDSITGTTVTKTGTNTFAQNRFYTARNLTFTCVRTGTEYTYTGGAATTTLTGISDTTGLIAGDILIQKIVTNTDKPASGRINDTLFVFENQLVLGSFSDNEVYISKNNAYATFSFSAPRVAGEGALLTLDGPSGGFGVLTDSLIVFAGRSSIFKTKYTEITVGTTLAETLAVQKLQTGINQGSQSPDCIISAGGSLIYLSYEPSLRSLDQGEIETKAKPKTLSNPIQPDFDAEDFTGAQGTWHKNALYITAPTASHVYILEFVEDTDGKVRRYWQPPQVLPVGSFAIIDNELYSHSNAVPETYKLFDGFSDVNSSDEKLPINCIAAFAYRSYKNRAALKNFDEYYVEGEISPSTQDLLMTLNYDYNGHTQTIERLIDGTDDDILEETLGGIPLGQAPLGQVPIGGTLTSPPDTRKFRVIFEIAREDFNEIQPIFSTNDIDKYFAITASGPNVVMSRRKNNIIKK